MVVGCGNSQESSKDCISHEWGDYKTQVAASELESGLEYKTCSKCGERSERAIDPIGFEYTVTFKNIDGSVIKSEKVRSTQKLIKPENPIAPDGQIFYGWKNVNNGG